MPWVKARRPGGPGSKEDVVSASGSTPIPDLLEQLRRVMAELREIGRELPA
jgi:2-phospho-L-lactate transferase/gluconeogenesis factor (CofD/UPF0052 family)